jgi:hypothetical protein
MQYRSIEVCLAGNLLPQHPPSEPLPVTTKEDFDRELSGWSCGYSWEDAVKEIRATGNNSMVFMAKK